MQMGPVGPGGLWGGLGGCRYVLCGYVCVLAYIHGEGQRLYFPLSLCTFFFF